METTCAPFATKYRIIGKKGEGTFSEVVKCQSIADGTMCAAKRMKGKFTSVEQINNLREIQALRRLHAHGNIIKLQDVIFDATTKTLDLVFELMDMNIYERIRGRHHHLPESLVKNFMYQLLKALDHMHRNGIFHRDVKPENILIKDEVLKLADLGSCRGIYSKPPFTEYISTRWYRAPECLLTDGYYSFKMDIWSAGCVFFEIMSLYPLFPGSNELDQINKIHDILGTPSPALLAKIRRNAPMKFSFPNKQATGIARMLTHATPECLDLLNGLLNYDPELRLSARQAMRHSYFKELRDADKRRAKLEVQAANDGAKSPSPIPAESADSKKDSQAPEPSEDDGASVSQLPPAAAGATLPLKRTKPSSKPLLKELPALPPLVFKNGGPKPLKHGFTVREEPASVLPQINPRVTNHT
eukprot:m.18113 g.18113  ORF g.18113 m.18113 type:complete len:415 (-) comp7298_c1_seq1:125-1369(-)